MLVDLSRPVWKPSLSSCAILPLYVKSPSYSGVGDGTLTVGAYSYADFMTYFGAFSLKKWRSYTGIDDLTPTRSGSYHLDGDDLSASREACHL